MANGAWLDVLNCAHQVSVWFGLLHFSNLQFSALRVCPVLSLDLVRRGMAEPMEIQDFHMLRCNWVCKDAQSGCKNATHAVCWITSCQHVLCDEHARKAFGHGNSCPVCGFRDARVIKANLSSEGRAQARKGIVPGLAPSEIMDSAALNVEFWIRQKALTSIQCKQRCLQLEERAGTMAQAAEEQIQAAHVKSKRLEEEQVDLQKRLDTLEAERGKVNHRISGLRKEISDAEMRYERVRSQVGGMEDVLSRQHAPSRLHSQPLFNFQGARRGVSASPRREGRAHWFAPEASSPSRDVRLDRLERHHIDRLDRIGRDGGDGGDGPGNLGIDLGSRSPGPRADRARGLRSTAPAFAGGWLGSARMTRRRIA